MVGVLKARVGGSWVDIAAGAIDEVWVGPDAPTDPNVQMWYDTDAPAVQDPNVAWGVVARALQTATQTLTSTSEVAIPLAALNYTLQNGRRYRISYVNRAIRNNAGQTSLNVKGNGVALNTFWWTGPGGWHSVVCEAYRDGDGVARAWTMTIAPGTTGEIVLNDGDGGGLYIEDVGPTVRT